MDIVERRIVGLRKTSLRFNIWLAEALVSSMDWMAAEDSVLGSSELVAEPEEPCGFADRGDLSPGQLLICTLSRLSLILRLTSWLGLRNLLEASMLLRASKLRLMSKLDRAESLLTLELGPPSCATGSGDSVALTFSRIGGASARLWAWMCERSSDLLRRNGVSICPSWSGRCGEGPWASLSFTIIRKTFRASCP